MKYFSTRDRNSFVSFRDAVMHGLASDGGLFLPEEIPSFPKSFWESLHSISFQEIGYQTAKLFIGDEISEPKLQEIIQRSINFPAPLVNLNDQMHVLELFHGPTLAFKDFGAQFMARTMEHFVKDDNRELVILVATSGDTGSAVAHGFYGVEGIKVFLLYPSGKVSAIQEKQLTTLDKNIVALEIHGTFDDCQHLVKSAFTDDDLKEKLNLSSANSINIARLIPQSFYYINAVKQLKSSGKEIIVSVPSGNLGNITAGLIAKHMGLPIAKFIAATNSNDVFTKYLSSGKFEPRKSVQTYSNAMDVGNPSNLERVRSLFGDDLEEMKSEIASFSFNDDETVSGIKEVYDKFGYVIDPHGSVGYHAMKKYLSLQHKTNYDAVVVETAHPAKFKDVVENTINREIEMPERLAECMKKKKHSIILDSKFETFKDFLLNTR
ncbi:MAG: threonine synthase [Bacteroidetes bacterium]|nr:threonine synthase [Bacteroidota bacterium]